MNSKVKDYFSLSMATIPFIPLARTTNTHSTTCMCVYIYIKHTAMGLKKVSVCVFLYWIIHFSLGLFKKKQDYEAWLGKDCQENNNKALQIVHCTGAFIFCVYVCLCVPHSCRAIEEKWHGNNSNNNNIYIYIYIYIYMCI